MPFLDTNSHLTTKPYNFDINVQAILKAMIDTVFLGPSLGGVRFFLLPVRVFFNKREYSGAGWPLSYIYILPIPEIPWRNIILHNFFWSLRCQLWFWEVVDFLRYIYAVIRCLLCHQDASWAQSWSAMLRQPCSFPTVLCTYTQEIPERSWYCSHGATAAITSLAKQ